MSVTRIDDVVALTFAVSVDGDLDGPAGGHRIAGVDHQVEQGKLKLIMVAADTMRTRCDADLDLMIIAEGLIEHGPQFRHQ